MIMRYVCIVLSIRYLRKETMICQTRVVRQVCYNLSDQILYQSCNVKFARTHSLYANTHFTEHSIRIQIRDY
jgi:hypothetical protein